MRIALVFVIVSLQRRDKLKNVYATSYTTPAHLPYRIPCMVNLIFTMDHVQQKSKQYSWTFHSYHSCRFLFSVFLIFAIINFSALLFIQWNSYFFFILFKISQPETFHSFRFVVAVIVVFGTERSFAVWERFLGKKMWVSIIILNEIARCGVTSFWHIAWNVQNVLGHVFLLIRVWMESLFSVA